MLTLGAGYNDPKTKTIIRIAFLIERARTARRGELAQSFVIVSI
jgi:hypothetical protein